MCVCLYTCIFILFRTGQQQQQSPDSTHMMPHPPQSDLPQQMATLQSLDAEFSQQPGPSGLQLLSPPTYSQGPMHLSSSSSSSAGGQTVPEPSSGGNVPNFGQVSPHSDQPPRPSLPLQPVFQIPLSQDLLATTQDISTGFSQTSEWDYELTLGG